MDNDDTDYATAFKAVADETRLKIIRLLSHGNLCACDILASFPITQPTLSYHMKILTDSGLVDVRREGIWAKYSINCEQAVFLRDFWGSILGTAQDYRCNECEVMQQ